MQSVHREAQSGSEEDLFFDTVVRRYVNDNPRFLRRDWLADDVENRLAKIGGRFVLLVARPGAGKSAFMSQLAHDHPDWLRYFIRHDQRTVLGDVSAKSLLLRIGFQLAARQPALFSQEQITLSVSQRIGEVANDGTAIGAEVERLTASPFFKVILRIEQKVQANKGRLVGLKVENLVVESRLLPDEDLLHLALIDPARALQRADSKQRITILIDALDEISYHATTENILTWLTNSPELPENIRFVITSRPADEKLKLFCAKQEPYISELTINQDDLNVSRDIEKFIDGLVGEEAFSRALTHIEGGVEGFANKAVVKAHGNLGYLDALARGIEQAHLHNEPQTLRALLNLSELPADIEGLYSFFLHQIKATVSGERVELHNSSGETFDEPVWPAVYSKILGVLAVAMEPLDLQQIQRLGRIRSDRSWLIEALERMVQFLDVSQSRYSFYHATVAEFLTAKTTGENSTTGDLYQDPELRHKQIADFYFNTYKGNWYECDQYGLRHLATHLLEANDSDRLQQLLCPSNQRENVWYTAKSIAGDLDGWQSDAERAMQLAEKTAAIDLQFRYALCLISVRSVKVPSGLLDLCLREQVLDWPQALSQARLHQDPETRAKEISRLAATLPEQVRERVVVNEFKAVLSMEDDRLLVDVAAPLARYLPEDCFDDLLSSATQVNEDRVLAELIVPYAKRFSENYFEDALELARSMQDPVPRLRSFGALAVHRPRPQTLLDEARSTPDAELSGYYVSALCEIAGQLRGRSRKALFDEAFELAKQLDYGTGLGKALAAFLHPGISKARISDILELASQTFERTYRDPNAPAAPGTIRDGYILILATLGPLLTEKQRKKYVEGMVNELQRWTDSLDIANRDVPFLAPFLPEETKFDACAKYTRLLIGNVGESHWPWTWRNDATLMALKVWPEQLLDTALEEVHALYEPYRRAPILRVLVSRLPQERRAAILREELARVGKIGNERARARSLAALVANVPVNARETIAEEAVHALEDWTKATQMQVIAFLGSQEADRSSLSPAEMEIIALLTNHLPPHRASSLLEQAVNTIRNHRSDLRSKGQAIAALAPSLPETMIPLALEIVGSIGYEHYPAISAFVAHFPQEEREEIVDKCLKAVGGVITAELPNDTVKVFQALGPHLEPRQVARAFKIAKEITSYHGQEKISALAALASGLQGAQREEAFDMVQSLSGFDLQPMAAFEPELARQRSINLLDKALAIETDDKRANALRKLIPHLTGAARLKALTAMLRSCLGVRGWQEPRERIERGFLLECIGEVADSVKEIGGEDYALRFASAIRETAIWWP